MALKDPNEARQLLKALADQPKKFVFGVDQAIFNCVLAFITPMKRDGDSGSELAQAHLYLLDLPGRGKTAILKYLSASIRAKLGRVDGRPDLMPSDLVGREEVDRFTGIRTLLKGPLHSNIFFFDEINRAPSKAQGLLLGAMEGGYVLMNVTNLERKMVEQKSFPLYPISEEPNEKKMFFIVIATANPIEFEGTYPLSEAQKERFCLSGRTGRPPREDEMRIRSNNVFGKSVEEVMDLSDMLDIQSMVSSIDLSSEASELMMRYIENSIPYSEDLRRRHATRDLIKFIDRYVASGCSPRRNFHMEAAAKAWAFMRGENRIATVDDIKAIAPLTMEHVVLLKPRSMGDNVTPRAVVKRIIDETYIP